MMGKGWAAWAGSDRVGLARKNGLAISCGSGLCLPLWPPTLCGMTKLAQLSSRAVLAITGKDRVTFLQGLVSNDVSLAAPGRAIWAAMLTPQGKWLADFFIFSDGTRLLLDAEAQQAPDLIRRLSRFRLRADAQIAPEPTQVYAAWDGLPPPRLPWAAPDPRLPEAGWRVLAAGLEPNASEDDYDALRITLGLPDGSRDLEPEKTVLLEAGFDELGGISWSKGCYMGQELTARTKYRGLLKRRLMPIRAEQGALPTLGTPVFAGGLQVGEIRSTRGGIGLALLRLDALDRPLECGGAIHVERPSWMTKLAAEPKP